MNKKLFELSYTLKKDFQKKVKFLFLYGICVFLVVNLILNFVVFSVRNVSESMEPDYSGKSCILFSPLKKSIKRCDIVLVEPLEKTKSSFKLKILDSFVSFFTLRQFSLISKRSNMGKNMFMRRVIAIPGDTIYMNDNILYIKPKGEDYFLTEFELVDKPYNISIDVLPSMWDSSLGVSASFKEITLGKDEYFVLGDHRVSCVDSRFTGAIKKKSIKANALFCFFPLNKIKVYF